VKILSYTVLSFGEHLSRLVLVILKITGVGDMTISARSLFQYFIILSTRNIFLMPESSLLQEKSLFFFFFVLFVLYTRDVEDYSFFLYSSSLKII